MSNPRQVCAVPGCDAVHTAVVCLEHRRALPGWLTASRGRTRDEMAHDVRAYHGAAALRPTNHEQASASYARRESVRGASA